jgi:hypothetical protein
MVIIIFGFVIQAKLKKQAGHSAMDQKKVLSSFFILTWDTWKVVAGTPGRRVEPTSWCRCRGWLAVLVKYLVIFLANHLSSTQAF